MDVAGQRWRYAGAAIAGSRLPSHRPIKKVNRSALVDSHNALDVHPGGVDHDGMERIGRQSCYGLSMLRLLKAPQQGQEARLIVDRVEIDLEGALTKLVARSSSETLDAWFARRGHSAVEPREASGERVDKLAVLNEFTGLPSSTAS